ncbi:MAG: leucine-rich repeat protein [Oscillospiraceae bacterium]
MSFDDGLILGLSMGGSSDDYKNNDPDFAKYKALPEPAPNQFIALLRVTEKGAGQELLLNESQSLSGVYLDQEGLIDWGDGTSELFGGTSTGYRHTYDTAGDYIITVTAYKNNYEYYKFGYNNSRNRAYFIAIKVGKDIFYADSLSDNGYYYISPSKNFKYMQFGSGYVLDGSFKLMNCNMLIELDILDDSVRPVTIPSYMFNACYALDFRNVMPLLSEVTEIGEASFTHCYGLKKLSLPKCTKIGSSAVVDCPSLTHINLPECVEIGNSSICGNNALREVDLPKCKTIGDNALSGYSIINKITVPDDCSISSTAMKNNYCLIPTPNGIYP